VRGGGDHYVTALKPSHHKGLLREAAGQWEPLRRRSGESGRAWRTERRGRGLGSPPQPTPQGKQEQGKLNAKNRGILSDTHIGSGYHLQRGEDIPRPSSSALQ
jgi:hypothetical protein